MWTNQSYIDIKKGLLKQEDEKQIMKTLRDMKTFGQDIDIYGFAVLQIYHFPLHLSMKTIQDLVCE